MSGIFGAVSKENCSDLLFYGTDYHSHLGTQFGGLAVMGNHLMRQIHDIQQSQFKSKFFEDYKKMKGPKGIGVISASEEQPIFLHSKFGPFCIVTNGLIENKDALATKLLHQGISFSEVSKTDVNSTELIAKLITLGDTIVHGIETMFDAIEGSCSLLLLHNDGIYAARDRLGYTPLVIGKKDTSWAITTETSAFPNLNFEIFKYMEPGEITLINENGITEHRKGLGSYQICAFLWIYTGFPAASYEGINVEIVRERCGRNLARLDTGMGIDLVSGVPDSGVAHAIGYAQESGKPLRRPLVKYTPGYGRSYTPPSQETRDLIATMKLVPIRDIINNQRIVVCEDSIVRGTQLKNFTVKKLWDCGAKEIHVRPACPPLMFPCRFNISTRSINELAARKAIKNLEQTDSCDITSYLDPRSQKYNQMIEWIRKDIEVTTLRYQTVDDMVKAIGLPKEKLCLYCWTGECSTCGKKEGNTKQSRKQKHLV
ncbi:MAG: amidophosphoribosyltransferase [Elusimicrobia bacterium]|nr:amidophosphoribosyltransferase [Elusimicrobiota bacterium]MBD3411988.1 amidophosphoribosyltransferase [Elusimicrobiota bacterium]